MIHFFVPMPYRPTARTEAKRTATRQRILDAALAQLAAGGYASASMQAVAERAGLATGSLYRHFPSKAALFAEVFRRGSDREMLVLEEATRADGRPAAERIGAGVEAFARRALAGPTRAYAFIAEPVDPAVEETRLAFRRAFRDHLRTVLEEGVAGGELSPHDTQTTAAAVVGALGEALVGPLSPRGGGGEATVAALVDFCIRAIPKEESRAGDPAHA
ncbi:MAG: TetR/AcrR family transcriptional regulator [Actinomycetota bacterium]|nr:TetR/AcrR family transcriptional regulator [Actinomycetota bacterium]